MNMPSLVTVDNIVGTSPFEIYLCLSGGSPCYYIDYVTSSELPYNFVVPIPIQNNLGFCLKVIDADNCTINNCFTIS